MKRAVVFATLLSLAATAALAQTAPANTTVELGATLTGQIRDIMVTVIAGVSTAFLAWVSYWLKAKFGIDIESKHREALQSFINRQASALLAMGAVKLEGVKLDVKSEAVASLARMAFTAIPDAMKYFGLSPDVIGQMIVDLIPKQPAIAQAQAVALDAKNPETPSVEAKGP